MSASNTDSTLASRIRQTESNNGVVEETLTTDKRVLARITDGIYRQPASALRELVSNAYDADATEVFILTDAPRFKNISVRDNGIGMSPEVLEHLVKHIGGSAKRSQEGIDLKLADEDDSDLSPSGRKLIGKLGIGLFSVAQFTRHFLIITKVAGDRFRTVADIILGSVAGSTNSNEGELATGRVWIRREPAVDLESHGTEIKLLDLLPRTRGEMSSADLWSRIDYSLEDPNATKVAPPDFHIGRMDPKDPDIVKIPAQLPWTESDNPEARFSKFVEGIRDLSFTSGQSVDLEKEVDNYLRTIWSLSLAIPIKYYDKHPFDLKPNDEISFYRLENRRKGQAQAMALDGSQTPRSALGLRAADGALAGEFEVYFDGMRLRRPLSFRNLPLSTESLRTPLLFIGQHREDFRSKPIEMSGGPLEFEAYLFWAPRINPKQHQGVILRVGNAAGGVFDPTFMNYEVSEIQRKEQVTAEIFVHQGLDGAINIDRESFNYAHPHYQFLTVWLHSAFLQFANRHKGLGSALRDAALIVKTQHTEAKIQSTVESSLNEIGRAGPKVALVFESELRRRREEGFIALRRDRVLPRQSRSRNTKKQRSESKLLQNKAAAITRLLHGWGLMNELSFEDQEKLVRAIMEIFEVD